MGANFRAGLKTSLTCSAPAYGDGGSQLVSGALLPRSSDGAPNQVAMAAGLGYSVAAESALSHYKGSGGSWFVEE